MNEKLLNTFDKINKYFSEEKLNFVEAQILQLFINEIQNYNEKKIKEFTDLYEYVFRHISCMADTNKDYKYQFRRLCKT